MSKRNTGRAVVSTADALSFGCGAAQFTRELEIVPHAGRVVSRRQREQLLVSARTAVLL